MQNEMMTRLVEQAKADMRRNHPGTNIPAANRLVQWGEWDVLVEMAQAHEEWHVRNNAVLRLATAIHMDGIADALLEIAKTDPDDDIREAAARAIGIPASALDRMAQDA